MATFTQSVVRWPRPVVRSWPRSVVVGAVAGVIGAMAMAIFAMVWDAYYKDIGFYTPMYHIASATGWDHAMAAMKTSMMHAKADDYYYLSGGPALAGLGIHMATGMIWGAVFGLVVRALRVGQGVLWALGSAFGVAVMGIMSWTVLPAAASAFDAGRPIRKMGETVGWGTFTLEHLVFGFMLGVVTTFGLALGRGRRHAAIDLTRDELRADEYERELAHSRR